MITIDTLREVHACEEAREAFNLHFPYGAPDWLTVANHPECEPEWRQWIAAEVLDLAFDERENIIKLCVNSKYLRGWIAVSLPGLTLAKREKLTVQSDRPGYWRTRIARDYQ